MKIGVPKEIKNNEGRVSMTPNNVKDYVAKGNTVIIETNAGILSGFDDSEYIEAGATIVETAKEVWSAEMIVKVKEPLKEEYKFFRKDLILYTYLHLAAEEELTNALIKNEVLAIAYETVSVNGKLPLLRPMSEIAGRRAVNIASQFSEKHNGGQGILLGGVPGVEPGIVTIIGDGVSAINAAKMAKGLGATVYVLSLEEDRIRYLDEIFDGSIHIIKSTEANIAHYSSIADALISTVLIPGRKAPKVVKEYMVKNMKKGAIIIDISIDQGGSVETIDRITTHDDPVFEKYGVLHYSVANMPGATPRTSTIALTNATINYGLLLAKEGANAMKVSDAILTGVNVYKGKITNKGVADSFGVESYNPLEL